MRLLRFVGFVVIAVVDALVTTVAAAVVAIDAYAVFWVVVLVGD